MRVRFLPLLLLAACTEPPDLSLLNDVIPPAVASVAPPAGLDRVQPDAVVTVRFSEPVDPATVTDQSFFLRQDQNEVGAELSVDGAEATLRPVVPLTRGLTYTARVTRLIRDPAGNALADSRTWSFTVVQSVLN